MVTVFRDGSHRLGTHLIWLLHFLTSIFSGALFRTRVIDSGNEKSRSPCYRRTADNWELEASALFENEKSRDSYGFTPQKSRQISK